MIRRWRTGLIWRRITALVLVLALLWSVEGSFGAQIALADEAPNAGEVFGGGTVTVAADGRVATGLEGLAVAPAAVPASPPTPLGPGTPDLTPKPPATMSRFERIAWGIAKALIPTVTAIVGTAVLGVATGGIGFVVAPFLLGGISSALVNYAYEARMNAAFRETPKDPKRMARDVFCAALADGVMAPFTVVTCGLGAVAGPITAKAVLGTVAKTAALNFAGKVASKGVSGLARNALNQHWIKNDEAIAAKEAAMKDLLVEIRRTGGADDALLARYLALEREAAELRAEGYSLKDFRRDTEQAAWSGLVSGVIGGAATTLGGTTDAAKSLSQAIFKDTSHANQIARIVTDLPVKFVEGTGNAKIDQIAIDREIADLRLRRQAVAEGSPEHVIIDRRIASLQQQRDQIDLLRAGAQSALTGLAINGVTLATEYGIYRWRERPQPPLANEEQQILRGDRADAADIKEYKEALAKSGADPELATSENPYQVEGLAKRTGVNLVVRGAKTATGVVMKDTVSLRQGDDDFGWQHISRTRPDGTNHAREIAAAFALPDQDESVRRLILDTVETGAALPDATRGTISFIKSFGDGRALKVVVSGTTNAGSIITAYVASRTDIDLAAQVGNIDLRTVDVSTPGKIDINTAHVVNIDMLRGMPTPVAQAIVKWRETNGPIRSMEQLLAIPGVTHDAVKLCRDFIKFD